MTLRSPIRRSSRAAGVVFEVELSNRRGPRLGLHVGRETGHDVPTGHTAELWWLDVASGMAHRLDALNGYAASGSRLPAERHHTRARAGRDTQLRADGDPIASGGYAWVVFTSRRMYGNVAKLPRGRAIRRRTPGMTRARDQEALGRRRRISTRRRAPTRATRRSTCRGRSSTRQLARVLDGPPCRADGRACDGRPMLRRVLPGGRRRGARVHRAGADVLGAVREVHARRATAAAPPRAASSASITFAPSRRRSRRS